MKKLFSFILLLFSLTSFSQRLQDLPTYVPSGFNGLYTVGFFETSPGSGVWLPARKMLSTDVLKGIDSSKWATFSRLYKVLDSTTIWFTPQFSGLGTLASPISIPVDSVNTPANMVWVDAVGNFHRSAVPSGTGGGSVSSVGSGFGLTGGPITTTGTLLVDSSTVQKKMSAGNSGVVVSGNKVYNAQPRDTFAVTQINPSTVVFTQPSIPRTDTFALSLTESDPLSVHITDSAAMLSGYVRKVDTFSKWVGWIEKNAGGDSLIFYKGTTRYAVADGSSGGGSGGIGGVISGATVGSVFFAGTGGKLQQKNSDFFYDSTNKYNGYGTNTPAARMHLVVPGLGTSVSAATTSGGIVLENNTAATAGNPQVSPSLTFTGQAWNTALGGSSNAASYRLQHLPRSTGSVAGDFYLQFLNGSTASTVGVWDGVAASYTQTGSIIASGGNISATSSASENTFTSNLFLNHATTGRYIRFNGGGGTIRAVIGHENTTGDLHFRVNDATSMSNGTAAMIVKQATGDLLVNTTTQDNSAIANFTSTGKALLPPRMTQAQRDAINLTVTSIAITNGGSGYTTTAPAITLTDPGYGGIRAIATAVATGGVITSITINNAGSYNTAPTVSASGGSGTGFVVGAVTVAQVLTAGDTFYCTDCTATDTSTGVMQTWNGSTWKNNW